jgi:hypothetical protein
MKARKNSYSKDLNFDTCTWVCNTKFGIINIVEEQEQHIK